MVPIFLLLALAFSISAADLESVSSIPASALDSLGDTAGSYGSGACYDRKAGILYLTTDRGPGDGAIDFSPRLYALPLPKESASKSELNLKFKSDESGPPGTSGPTQTHLVS